MSSRKVAPGLARVHSGSLTHLHAPARWVVTAWGASHLIVPLAAFAAEHLVARNPKLVPGSGIPLLSSLTSWDGWWCLGIARNVHPAAPISGQRMVACPFVWVPGATDDGGMTA